MLSEPRDIYRFRTVRWFSHVVVFCIFMLDGRAFSHSLSLEHCGFRCSLWPNLFHAL